MNPEILAMLAQIAAANADVLTRTGEPCRCPEAQPSCICGAYELAAQ